MRPRFQLRKALESQTQRPHTDRDDFRIRLEFIAIKLNRLLLERFRAETSGTDFQTEASIQDVKPILLNLISLKEEAKSCAYLPPPLREKFNANINVNCCLLLHFVAPSTGISLLSESIYSEILTEAFVRVIGQEARISYFEEIVVFFVALNNPRLVKHSDFQELELVGSLRTKLSRVLQRDQRTNEFENWMYRYIQGKLHAIGY